MLSFPDNENTDAIGIRFCLLDVAAMQLACAEKLLQVWKSHAKYLVLCAGTEEHRMPEPRLWGVGEGGCGRIVAFALHSAASRFGRDLEPLHVPFPTGPCQVSAIVCHRRLMAVLKHFARTQAWHHEGAMRKRASAQLLCTWRLHRY